MDKKATLAVFSNPFNSTKKKNDRLYGFYHIKATVGSIRNFQFLVEKLTKKKDLQVGSLNQPVIEA